MNGNKSAYYQDLWRQRMMRRWDVQLSGADHNLADAADETVPVRQILRQPYFKISKNGHDKLFRSTLKPSLLENNLA